jgi:FxsC-like protein
LSNLPWSCTLSLDPIVDFLARRYGAGVPATAGIAMYPIFFLSHATNEALEADQERFYKDLVDMLKAERGSLDRDQIGFMATESIQTGDVWPDRVAKALQTCQVFVYMQSDSYFSRPWCSKEWAVFRERIDQWIQGQGAQTSRPPLMIPVHWKPAKQPHPAAVDADIQYTEKDFTNAYAEVGLHALMNLTKYKDDYFEFRQGLARRILAVYDQYPLPAAAQAYEFKTAPEAFGLGAAVGGIVPVNAPGKGPRFVVFVYVVARRNELTAFRQDLECYGDDGWLDWKPFQPVHQQRMSWFAEGAVHADGHLDYQQLEMGPALVAELRQAEQANKIIILIVDSWSLHLGAYANPISQFDQVQFRNCSVVIPWRADGETQAQEAALKGLLRQTLSRQPASRLRFGVTSPEHFAKTFEEVIRQARKEALSEVFQVATADNGVLGFAAKPMVEGNRSR